MSQKQSAIESPWLETTNVDFSFKCPSRLGRKALCFLNPGTQADEQAGCIHCCARMKGRSEGLVYAVTSHWTKAVWKVITWTIWWMVQVVAQIIFEANTTYVYYCPFNNPLLLGTPPIPISLPLCLGPQAIVERLRDVCVTSTGQTQSLYSALFAIIIDWFRIEHLTDWVNQKTCLRILDLKRRKTRTKVIMGNILEILLRLYMSRRKLITEKGGKMEGNPQRIWQLTGGAAGACGPVAAVALVAMEMLSSSWSPWNSSVSFINSPFCFNLIWVGCFSDTCNQQKTSDWFLR